MKQWNTISRRRLLGALSAALPIIVRPGTTFAQERKKLPHCVSRQSFGSWQTEVHIRHQSITASGRSEVIRDFINPVRAIAILHEFDDKGERYVLAITAAQPEVFVLRIQHSDGTKIPDAPMKESFALRTSDYPIARNPLDALLKNPDSPLLRPGKLSIELLFDKTVVAKLEADTNDYARALQSITTQKVALLEKEKNNQCDACFITTACCDELGLPDDCFELTALRKFRDGPLLAMHGGPEDIERYYRTAPLILESIRARNETARLRRLYLTTILPCALAAHVGMNQLARTMYSRMMRRMERRYLESPR